MAKKVIKKKSIKKKTTKKSSNKDLIAENFVALQRVMVNLSERFDELSNQISKLLNLFELSANAMAKKEINFTKPLDEEKIMGKLNNILDQNKIIARGLSLMHEQSTNPPQRAPLPVQKAPVKPAPQIKPNIPRPTNPEQYQKSKGI